MKNWKEDKFISNIKGREINLKEYYHLIKSRLWIIVLLTVLTTAAGYYYSNSNNTPLYQSSTRILINEQEGQNESMNTLMVMIKDPIVMENVRNQLELTAAPELIAGQIEVAQIGESEVIQITVTANTAKLAADIANTTAETAKTEIASILNFNGIELLSPAKENKTPVNPVTNRLTIMGLLFGLATGTGLVFLLDSLDNKVRKERDIEELLGVPVLGSIPKMKKAKLSHKQIPLPEVEVRSETIGHK